MNRTFPSTGVLSLLWSMPSRVMAGTAVLLSVTGHASASPVTYDSILRHCSSAAVVIDQGETTKDEQVFTDTAVGDWLGESNSHVGVATPSGPVQVGARSTHFSSVNDHFISFAGAASVTGTSILTPALSADSTANSFISVFFTVMEPVGYKRSVVGATTGLFLAEDPPFGEITEMSGVLAPGRYSISAGVARRLDDGGPGASFGLMRLEFFAVPAPGGVAALGMGACVMARRRRARPLGETP